MTSDTLAPLLPDGRGSLISESNDSLKIAGKGAPAPPPSRNWGALVSGLITATGNFNVQYNFGAIAIALIVMSSVQCTSSTAQDCQQGHQASWVNGTASATVFAGAIFGQLTMGYAGDIVGRNIAMTLTLSIAALGALLSALLPSGSPQSVYITIIVCRFILGIGLGGIYPLAATKAAEDSAAAKALLVLEAKADAVTAAAANPPSPTQKQQQGSVSISFSNGNPNPAGEADAASLDENAVDVSSAAWAFFWQAPGAMTPWLIALLMTYGSSNMSMDTRWRLLLGLGTIPASIAVILSFVEARLNARQLEDLMARIEEAEEAEMALAGDEEEDKYLGALTSAMDIENTFMGKGGRDTGAPVGGSPSIPLVAATAQSSGGGGGNASANDSAPAPTTATLGLNPKPAHSLRNRNRTGSGFSSQHSVQSTGSDANSFLSGRSGKNGGGSVASIALSYYSMRSSLSYRSQHSVMAEKGGLKTALSATSNQRKLIVTGGGWFLYDVCYYGVALFGGQILGSIDHPDDDNVSSDVNIRSTTSKELIALSMAIPGTLLSIYLLKRMTTKRLQVMGFCFIAVCFVLLALLMKPLRNSPNALFVLYCALLFALTFGPNVTTYILPAETYPKEIRSTFNGISAACGKLGAVVGAYVFGPLAEATSFNFVFYSCAVLAVIGAIISHVFIEDKHVVGAANDYDNILNANRNRVDTSDTIQSCNPIVSVHHSSTSTSSSSGHGVALSTPLQRGRIPSSGTSNGKEVSAIILSPIPETSN